MYQNLFVLQHYVVNSQKKYAWWAIHNGSKCRIKLSEDLSDFFEAKEWLKQGDDLSKLLFNVALEGAMRFTGI